MSNNQLAIYNGDGFEVMVRAAGAMAKSGFFQDSRDVSQAMVKVMAGAELGIAPFAAMSGIAIIKGKPSLGASLMAGIVKNDHRYDYRVVKHDDTVCQIQFYELGHDGKFEKSGLSTFTAKDAQRAGTQNMSKFPKNMLFARAMSNGFKWYCAGAGGGMPVYSDGELDTPKIITTSPSPANIDEYGVIDGEFDGYEHEQESAPFVPDEFDAPVEETVEPKMKPIPAKPTTTQKKQFHAVGKEVYGDKWDTKRGELVKHITEGLATSSKNLTRDEMKKLIDGMVEKKNAAIDTAFTAVVKKEISEVNKLL